MKQVAPPGGIGGRSDTVQRYVAFLRAINVGGHVVKMEALRALFEARGYSNVATFIASGNVIFESPVESARTLEEQIEHHLNGALGYNVATFVRSASDLATTAEYQPFPADEIEADGASLYVAFLHESPSNAARQSLLALCSATDDFHTHEREIYWLCRTRLSDSRVFTGGLFEKAIAMPVTMRNMTTVRKLVAKYYVRA
jgi:uncharacterized protein (DUF1697 family)